jgi:hypothetical protein
VIQIADKRVRNVGYRIDPFVELASSLMDDGVVRRCLLGASVVEVTR